MASPSDRIDPVAALADRVARHNEGFDGGTAIGRSLERTKAYSLLSERNARLRAQLTAAQAAVQDLNEEIAQLRKRVEALEVKGAGSTR